MARIPGDEFESLEFGWTMLSAEAALMRNFDRRRRELWCAYDATEHGPIEHVFHWRPT